MRKIEVDVQQKWEEDRVFDTQAEFDSEGNPKPKFMVTFPYPYMNGRLHLGHAFSLTKAEFTAGYQRLKGKNVLFPFGFHCTGMPIQAAANKLKDEITQFGVPPVFPDHTAEAKSAEPAQKAEVVTEKKGKGKKTKLVQKTGSGIVRQWDILAKMVPETEIPEFADPMKWLSYFPPYGQSDLAAFGTSVDWRR